MGGKIGFETEISLNKIESFQEICDDSQLYFEWLIKRTPVGKVGFFKNNRFLNTAHDTVLKSSNMIKLINRLGSAAGSPHHTQL